MQQIEREMGNHLKWAHEKFENVMKDKEDLIA